MTRQILSRAVPMTCALAGLLFLAGCGGIRNPVSRDALIRNNPTPELKTLDLRGVDRDNRRAIATDEDWRMLAEDWDRAWYINRASRLTSYPVR